jgi:hypothetical protein
MTSDIYDQRHITDKLIDLDVSFYFYQNYLSAYLKHWLQLNGRMKGDIF